MVISQHSVIGFSHSKKLSILGISDKGPWGSRPTDWAQGLRGGHGVLVPFLGPKGYVGPWGSRSISWTQGLRGGHGGGSEYIYVYIYIY